MTHVLAVAVGGALGSVLRYLIFLGLDKVWTAFPWSTLGVNAAGSFTLGLFLSATQTRFPVSAEVRSLISVGVLGGFTTFSTFGQQTMMLWQNGRPWAAGANVVLNILLGLAAAALGWRLGRGI